MPPAARPNQAAKESGSQWLTARLRLPRNQVARVAGSQGQVTGLRFCHITPPSRKACPQALNHPPIIVEVVVVPPRFPKPLTTSPGPAAGQAGLQLRSKLIVEIVAEVGFSDVSVAIHLQLPREYDPPIVEAGLAI